MKDTGCTCLYFGVESGVQEILDKANKLGIGPMGYGGKTTLLGVLITKLNRIPASFFVSVSYMCWAYRRRRMIVGAGGPQYL